MEMALGGRSFLGTFCLVLIAIAGLFAIDAFLAKTERTESAVEAARLFEQGRDLMQRGEYASAIDRIEDALSIERDNLDYERVLAQAQLAAGRGADAESRLRDLLQTDPTDGLASLIMARALAKEARFEDATSYFHRAIYGHWSADAAGNRLRVRLELIDLLAQRNSKEELLAELLAVQDQLPGDLETRIRIGRLFLAAGSPARAADVFRRILHDDPVAGGAYAGLGEAEFARGNYRSAQRDFLAALRFAPDNQAARQHLDLCGDILKLDPTIRGLSTPERFGRSIKLVELTLEDATQCVGPTPSPQLQELMDAARKTLKEHLRVSRQGEALEANLDLAEQLWQARKAECKAALSGENPLALVLSKLAQ